MKSKPPPKPERVAQHIAVFTPEDLKFWELGDPSKFSEAEIMVIMDIARRRKKETGGIASRYARVENIYALELSNRAIEKSAVIKKSRTVLIDEVSDYVSLSDLPRLAKLPGNFNSWKLVERTRKELKTDRLPFIKCGLAMVNFLIGADVGLQVQISNPPLYHVKTPEHWWKLTYEGNDYVRHDKFVVLDLASGNLCTENPSKVFFVRNKNIRI